MIFACFPTFPLLLLLLFGFYLFINRPNSRAGNRLNGIAVTHFCYSFSVNHQCPIPSICSYSVFWLSAELVFSASFFSSSSFVICVMPWLYVRTVPVCLFVRSEGYFLFHALKQIARLYERYEHSCDLCLCVCSYGTSKYCSRAQSVLNYHSYAKITYTQRGVACALTVCMKIAIMIFLLLFCHSNI